MARRAFYDFRVSPYSFDFAIFLMAARSQECDEIVIVPGARMVMGHDGQPVEFQKCTPGEQEYRLNAIIKGLCPKAIVCQTIGEARSLWHEDCFPPGYTIDKPVAAHTMGTILKQLRILPFMPSKEATEECTADGWNDPKMVVITIRYSKIKSGRNSIVPEWVKAADWMRSAGLVPVFVPDTDVPDMEFVGADGYKHLSCKKACLDVQYRLALYEKAYLNVGVNNGPMALNMFSRRPMLYFRPITHGYYESTEPFWRANGVPVRSQLPWFPPLQRIIWEGMDDFPNIKVNVERWLAASDGKDEWPLAVAPNYPIVGVLDGDVRGRHMTTAARIAKERGWKQMVRKAHGDGMMSIVCFGPSLKDTWREIKRPMMTISGAHEFLLDRGVVPEYHVDCDPREHKAKMCKGAHKDVKYRMATCCHPIWWDMLKDQDVELWHLHNDEHSETWVRKNDPGANMLGGGSTAGMRALEVGSMLGYRRFEIHGMDCSCTGPGERHAAEHLGKKQNEVEVSVDGRWFLSTPQMVESAKEMITFIQNYDCEIKFRGWGLQQAMVKHFTRRFMVIDPPENELQRKTA